MFGGYCKGAGRSKGRYVRRVEAFLNATVSNTCDAVMASVGHMSEPRVCALHKAFVSSVWQLYRVQGTAASSLNDIPGIKGFQ